MDSGDYSLALQFTNNFHNELVNDLIPAVESNYSTYADSTDLAGLRGFLYLFRIWNGRDMFMTGLRLRSIRIIGSGFSGAQRRRPNKFH